MATIKDITGNKYGRLTVVSISGVRASNGGVRWNCMCDCGNYTTVAANNLTRGIVLGCGCLITSGKGIKHGMRYTVEYDIWSGMIQRCYDEKHHTYKYYGARGITVCGRWRNSFMAFYEDMGKRPNNNMSIDRINNDGNYEPNNCRWATPRQQAYNRRDATWTTTTTTVDTAAVD